MEAGDAFVQADLAPAARSTWQDTLLGGILVGGALGGVTAWMLSDKSDEGGETTERSTEELMHRAAVLLGRFPLVQRDGAIVSALQEPVPLFLQLDPVATQEFLQSLEELIHVFLNLREGSTQPSKVSDALRARREASNRLLCLVRKARQRKPLAACDIEEDVETLKKSMDGFVHNCMQQSNLNIMETLS